VVELAREQRERIGVQDRDQLLLGEAEQGLQMRGAVAQV
jgi:hypothetical protein